MYEELKAILNNYLDGDYAIISNADGTSSVVFFKAYFPYQDGMDGKIFIDAYFRASNELYHRTNALIDVLNRNGIMSMRNYGNLKELAVKSKLAFATHTTLTANKRYGTRIVLGAITVQGEHQRLGNEKNLCVNCYECVRACPTGALTKEGFIRKKCIRQLQLQSAVCSDNYAKAMGNKVMGCDICQRACPLNACNLIQPIPRELEQFLNVDFLLFSAYQGKASIAPLEQFIGKNYLRPNKLLSLSLNASNNLRSFTHINIVKGLCDSHDSSISINANRLLNSYNNRH